jgi:hypothetical protein
MPQSELISMPPPASWRSSTDLKSQDSSVQYATGIVGDRLASLLFLVGGLRRSSGVFRDTCLLGRRDA